MDFLIDCNFAQRFVEALHANQTMTTLHIPPAFLEVSAVESVFVTYMQTRNGVGTSCIHTLVVSGTASGDLSNIWHAVARLLKGPRGSGLESVKLKYLYKGCGLWACLARQEQSRNLRSLEVALQNDQDFMAMLKHLPRLLYLQKLHVRWHRVPSEADCQKFLWAVRINGSLHSVSSVLDPRGACIFTGKTSAGQAARWLEACWH
jgi:hypothetical protein